ncbi:MAG: hypothetical protein HND48_23905 [Chloroflexi bacterium]|nr:hypothetical protein [Chloroflexota bacterium]
MQQVAAALGKLAAIDTDLRDWAEVAEGIAAQVQDLAVEMADYADTVEYNPQRLNDIEERLEVINKLKRRYNADSVAALLARAPPRATPSPASKTATNASKTYAGRSATS